MSSGTVTSGPAAETQTAVSGNDVVAALTRSERVDACLLGIPEETLASNPWLLFWYGNWCLPGDPARGRAYLERAYAGFEQAAEPDPAGLYLSWAGVVDAVLLGRNGFRALGDWAARYDSLQARFPVIEHEPLSVQVGCARLGLLVYTQPHHPEIDALAERLRGAMSRGDDTFTRLRICSHLMELSLWRGDFHGAAELIGELEPLIDESTLSASSAALWHCIRAQYEQFTSVTVGCDFQKPQSASIIPCLVQAGRAALVSDDLVRAREAISRLSEVLAPEAGYERALYHQLAGWLALAEHDGAAALEQAELALRFAREAGVPFLEAVSHAGLAQAAFELGLEDRAREQLAMLEAAARTLRSRFLEYIHRTISAVHAVRAEQGRQALKAARAAFALVREQGYGHFPYCVRRNMALLARAALEHGIETDAAQSMVRRYGLVLEEAHPEVLHWPWPVKIFTLGRFEVFIEGEALPVVRKPQQKPLEMLKILLAAGGRNVSQQEVTDLMWPDADGDVGQQSFATTLHRLRKLLRHPECIVLQDGRMTLDGRLCWTDAWYFECLTEELFRMARSGKRSLSAEQTRQAMRAVEFYKGQFLGNDFRSVWAVSMQERLKTRFLRVVELLAGHLEATGHWRQAVDYYLKGLDVDDLIESFYLGLMNCYSRQGHHSEAILVYQRCEQTLKAGLGIAPSQRLDRLYHELQRQAS